MGLQGLATRDTTLGTQPELKGAKEYLGEDENDTGTEGADGVVEPHSGLALEMPHQHLHKDHGKEVGCDLQRYTHTHTVFRWVLIIL